MARVPKNTMSESVIAERPTKSLFDRVTGYLDANDWHYQSDASQGFIDLHTRIKDTSVRVILDVFQSDDWQRVLVYSIYPVFVPEGRRTAVLEAINRINYRLIYGNFELDLSDGELRIRTVVESDAEIPDSMMERAFHSNLSTADKFFGPIIGIAFGNISPEIVLDLEPRKDNEVLQ